MSDVDELAHTMQLAGVDEATIERNPGSTIMPSGLGTASRPEALLALLGGESLQMRVELRGTLGEGGMGIVRVGHQRALDRAVAVKSLKPDHRDPPSVARLLREAWVTGYLDHPNVVPVYDIVADDEGAPLIVLKKIEGVAWAELIHDAEAVRSRFDAPDLFEWNLDILLQVMHAIGFAHSRGVLHRDIKPENVMIGAFGEVYVVDWGLAVMLEDDGTGRLPTAASANVLAGTPSYMAPEMLGTGLTPTERTDVYLLGAVLYEIATGQVPHRGDAFIQILSSIARSEPELPDHVPPPLAATIRRAMHRDMSARHASVEELQREVRKVLRSRDVQRLIQRGDESSKRLRALLSGGAAGETEAAVASQARGLYIEARAAFKNALDLWPAHDDARARLSALVGAMVDYELSRGQPEAAHALLVDLDAPSEELESRIEAARRDKGEEADRLRELARDHDPARGQRTRVAMTTILGSMWALTPIVVNVLLVYDVMHLTGGFRDLAIPLGMLATLLGFGYWARESMMATKINRLLFATVVVGMASTVLGATVGILSEVSPWTQIRDQLLVFSALAVILAVAIERLFVIVGAVYALGYLSSLVLAPEHMLFVLGICNASIVIVALLRWGRPLKPTAPAP